MTFCLEMSREEFGMLYYEIDRTGSSILMDFYQKISSAAIEQAKENKSEAEEILAINELDGDWQLKKKEDKHE